MPNANEQRPPWINPWFSNMYGPPAGPPFSLPTNFPGFPGAPGGPLPFFPANFIKADGTPDLEKMAAGINHIVKIKKDLDQMIKEVGPLIQPFLGR